MLYKCYIIISRNEGRKIKKEIVKNDRKWICEEKENYYEVKYYEYSKICNVWTYVNKDNWSRELVEELESGE